ncbi:MAG: hypothetical protein MUO53_15110, partial [Maribacter sp.]|nr:hypothetical protein [Maribacter sp.]
MKNIFFTIITTAFFLQGCSKDSNPDPIVDPTPTPTPLVSTVKLADNATFGKIMTDADGKSLYFFSLDTKDNSACLDGCLTVWPVFYKASITVDAGLQASDFTTIDRPDGTKQTSYKGWPLYYFANDNAAGDTNGDKVNDVWYVAKPDYSLMYVQAQLVGHDGKNYLDNYTDGEGVSFYLVDIAGKTLYSFKNDAKNTNNFTSPDFSNNSIWPIAEISIDKIPSILNPTDFGTINVFGKTQLTYKGWPLYYFGQDTARGDNKGISFPTPGVWPIVNAVSPLAPAPASTIKLAADGTFGNILTDADGKSLYFF